MADIFTDAVIPCTAVTITHCQCKKLYDELVFFRELPTLHTGEIRNTENKVASKM